MKFFRKVSIFFVAIGTLFILSGGDSVFASTIYSQPYIGTNINLGTSEPFSTRHYGYFFAGVTAENGHLSNPGFWTATAPINKVRFKKVSGTCPEIGNSAVVIDSTRDMATHGQLSFNGSSTGDFCDATPIGGAIPAGTQISAIYVTAENVGAYDMVLDGSPNNGGISLNGFNSDPVNGGFAFQLCTDSVCDGTFLPATPPPPTRNPVLIIPGVLGTDILQDGKKLWLDLARSFSDIGDQFMDPLQFNENLTPSISNLNIGNVIDKIGVSIFTFDYSSGLVQEFENQGYTQGTNLTDSLFLFPYDWRYGVDEIIINQLKQKIQNIRTQTGSDKVDIIAHSAGGLLVKKYVADYSVENYIDKAVFVGVPNTGSPQAVKNLLHGSNFSIPWLSDIEMKKISKNMPMVYDLLPSEQYFNEKGSFIKVIGPELFDFHDLNFTESKSFLINDHGLNSQALNDSNNLHTLSFDNFDLRSVGIDLYSINGCKSGTLSKIIERRTRDTLGNIVTSYDEPERTPGDDTVPLESASNLPIDPSNKYYALKASHPKMLSQDGVRQQIVNLISGTTLNIGNDKITQDISECKLNGRAFAVYSPLDIDIIDQYGNHSGLSAGGIENNIPNANFEIMGEHKFVYLPTDEGQTYTISLKGTGSGTFTLTSTDIVDNDPIQIETFADIPVTTSLKGNLEISDSTVLYLDRDGDNIVDIQLSGIPGEVVYMPYTFSGFFQPINDIKYNPTQNPSVFKTGSTIPVKFQLKNFDGNTVQANSTPTWLTPQRGSMVSASIDETTYSLPATTGTEFKWDSLNQQYIYNWSTKGLTAGYWYKISVKLDDGNVYTVTVGLK